LLKAGYKGQEFRSALEAVADAASLSADGVEGAGRAMEALTRMKLTGRMDARSLKGLGLEGHEIQKELGKALGMDVKSVKKGLEEGTIPAAKAFEVVLRGLEKKTGKGLGESGLFAGRTLEAKLTHLAELPARLMGRLEGSPAMERLKERFDKMLSGLDPDSPAGQKIIGGLEKLMGAISETDFDPLFRVLADLPTTISTCIGPIADLATGISTLVNAMLKVPQASHDMGDFLSDIGMGIKRSGFEDKMAAWNAKHKTKSVFADKPQSSLERSALEDRQRELEDQNAKGWKETTPENTTQAWKGAPWAIQPMTAGVPLPDISKAKTVTVSAPVTNHNTIHTVVQVTQPNATKEEIGEAVGRHSAKEIEKLSLKNGGRPAVSPASAPAQGGQ
jgi:tape measure domain-containing protein